MLALSLRINVARRAARELVALAEQRAARARPEPQRNTFRPLSEGETEEIVGAELLATLAARVGAPK